MFNNEEMMKRAKEMGVAMGQPAVGFIDEDVSAYWDTKEKEAMHLFNKYRKSIDGTYIIHSQTSQKVWLLVYKNGCTHLCSMHDKSRSGLYDVFTFRDIFDDYPDMGETMLASEMANLGWFDNIKSVNIEGILGI